MLWVLMLIGLLVTLIVCVPGTHVTAVQPGANSTLSWATTSGGTYAAVGLAVEIGGPAPTVEKIDTTILTSTVKTSRPSIPDQGEITLKAWYDPADAGHVEMLTALNTGVVLFWKLTYGDIQGTVDAFTAYVSAFARSGIQVGENLAFDMTIVVTNLIATTHTNPTL